LGFVFVNEARDSITDRTTELPYRVARDVAGASDKLDVVGNNAGIVGANKPTDEEMPEEWETVINVNARGVFFCTKRAVPQLRGAGCYLGVEMRANISHFDPALPDDLRRIRVRLHYRRQMLDVDVDHDALRIHSRSLTTTPITIAYRGHYRDLAPGDDCQFRLLKPEERDRDENRDRQSLSRAAITAKEPGP
jgi:NAD(P)-dependent dehydrogenase (short-subunit alcohol dehydrogenase family)